METMARELDVRTIPTEKRSPEVVFREGDALKVGETLRIINDHDPRPLRYAFEATRKGRYEWVAEQSGPTDWKVRIKKL